MADAPKTTRTAEERAAITALRERVGRAKGVYQIDLCATDGLGRPVSVLEVVAWAHDMLDAEGEPR